MRSALSIFLLALIAAPLGHAKPNVLFIAVDDMRAELGCYGAAHVISPHIDALAARGTLFENAYCQQAVCNPSRASLLTGLRPNTLRIWDLPTHFRERRPDVVTLPQHFKANGYRTEGYGKIFHNWAQERWKGDALSWSAPQQMHYASHNHDLAKVEGGAPPNLITTPRSEMRDVTDEAYFDGRVATLAIDSLERLAGADGPFFLGVGFWKPHAPFNAPKKYWDLYDRAKVAPPANPEAPQDVPAIALHDSREILRGFKDRPNNRPTAEDTIALRHGYYAAISYVDAQIGKVIDALDRLKLTNDTVIVLWSDHGFHLGEHSLWAKTSNFELDARVPMIVVEPGGKAGQRCSNPVELLDLYPTLTELCGLDAPGHLEGKSLVPILRDPKASVKPAAITWHPRPAYPARGADPEVMGYSARSATHRYTEWRRYADGELIATELYDHRSDAAETQNIATAPGQEKVIGPLAAELQPHLLKKPPVQPNIILVMADDMGWGQTGYRGHPVLKTPHLDSMAAAGLRFERFYAGAANCSPTRATVLTGRSNDRTGVFNHGFALRKQEKTLAQALRTAGYATGHFGKWHLNGLRGPGVPILKEDSHGPAGFGFDHWISVTNFFDRDPVMSRQGEFEEFKGDSSEIIVTEALQFIDAQRAAKKPSFSVIWYGTPHSPFRAAAEDRLPFVQLKEGSANHYGELVAMDRSIGALRTGLRKLGIADNTLVWFCSDNGGLPGIRPTTTGGLRGHKNSMYEGGLRVPAILEWPLRIKPRITSHPACTMDIFPTLAEIVGLPRESWQEPQDGMSLGSLFERETGARKKPIPFRHDGRPAWVDNEYKLVRAKRGGPYELFNLAKDPDESEDLLELRPQITLRMQSALEAWEKTVEASVAGKDYPGEMLDPNQPPRIFWTEVEAYKPFFDAWRKRPEYRSRLRDQ